MIIEFKVKNFNSIREEQALSLVASKYYREMEKQNCFDPGGISMLKLVRSAVIYGPNASGKSNLLSAVSFMQYMVLSSAKDVQAGEVLSVTPFLLDRSSKNNESEFEIHFIEGGVRYQYGFALNKIRVLREWLIAYPERRPQRWFDREYKPASKKDLYEFGPKFAGGRLRQDWRNATRSNALFLSVAVQFNSEQLKPVFDWFRNRLRVLPPHFTRALDPGYTAKACLNETTKQKVLGFLNTADLGVADIGITKKKFSPEDLPHDMPADLRKHFMKELEGKEGFEVKFLHKNLDTGEMVSLDPGDESEGTKNLFSFAGPWLDVLTGDKVLFVDEIDTSLHPLVVHQLVRLLHRSEGKAQLVFTTHDTTLLSQEIMRRDQVWFIEKDKANASKLFPLSDFKVRDKEALERGYLRGRYGAIPFIQEMVKI
jgi:uncharacterized protein